MGLETKRRLEEAPHGAGPQVGPKGGEEKDQNKLPEKSRKAKEEVTETNVGVPALMGFFQGGPTHSNQRSCFV